MDNLGNIRPVAAKAAGGGGGGSWDYPSIQDEATSTAAPQTAAATAPQPLMGLPASAALQQQQAAAAAMMQRPPQPLMAAAAALQPRTVSAMHLNRPPVSYQRPPQQPGQLFPAATTMAAAATVPVPMQHPQFAWPHPMAMRPPVAQQQQPAYTVMPQPVIPLGQVPSGKLEGEEDDEERSDQEELFPKGRTAELQKSMNKTGEKFIGESCER